MKHSLLAIILSVIILPATVAAADADTYSQLKSLQKQRRTQEQEYSKSFEALSNIKNELMAEREDLEKWLANQIYSENNLLKNIKIVGAPHNVLKIRARQRQLMNAKRLFEGQREEKIAALEEKETEWESQWASLKKSQELTRAKFNSRERMLLGMLGRQRAEVTEVGITHPATLWMSSARQRYLERRRLRAQLLKDTVKNAKRDNYLTRSNPEVVSQLRKAADEKKQHEQAMEVKHLMEKLGILGSVADEVKASLYFHLFGKSPESNAASVDVSNGY